MSGGGGNGARNGGRGNRTKLAPHQERRLRTMAKEGYTLTATARSLGVSHHVLKPIAKDLGVEFKTTGRGGNE